MVRKILKYFLMVVSLTIFLILILVIKPATEDINTNNTQKSETVEEQVLDVFSVDETDRNIIGYISIEKIGLEKAPIADGTDSKTINKYVGHFENTSYLEGNVCLCSHNRGNNAAYFGGLKNLNKGHIITYITKYETKEYEVKEVRKIEETDLSVLEQTEENQITLITCIENQRNLRLCVVGIEKAM